MIPRYAWSPNSDRCSDRFPQRQWQSTHPSIRVGERRTGRSETVVSPSSSVAPFHLLHVLHSYAPPPVSAIHLSTSPVYCVYDPFPACDSPDFFFFFLSHWSTFFYLSSLFSTTEYFYVSNVDFKLFFFFRIFLVLVFWPFQIFFILYFFSFFTQHSFSFCCWIFLPIEWLIYVEPFFFFFIPLLDISLFLISLKFPIFSPQFSSFFIYQTYPHFLLPISVLSNDGFKERLKNYRHSLLLRSLSLPVFVFSLDITIFWKLETVCHSPVTPK